MIMTLIIENHTNGSLTSASYIKHVSYIRVWGLPFDYRIDLLVDETQYIALILPRLLLTSVIDRNTWHRNTKVSVGQVPTCKMFAGSKHDRYSNEVFTLWKIYTCLIHTYKTAVVATTLNKSKVIWCKSTLHLLHWIIWATLNHWFLSAGLFLPLVSS